MWQLIAHLFDLQVDVRLVNPAVEIRSQEEWLAFLFGQPVPPSPLFFLHADVHLTLSGLVSHLHTSHKVG